MKNPKRIGHFTEKAGRLFLVNDADQQYEVSYLVSLMWRAADGKHGLEDILSIIGDNAMDIYMKRPRMRKTLAKAIDELSRMGLMTYS